MLGVRTLALALILAPASFAVAQSLVADAAMDGKTDEVRRLLKDGADVNLGQADGATALHWAAYHRDADLAKLLLESGANVSAANRDGSTPMWLAASQGDAKMVDTLLEGGADANEPLPLGRRPLMLAARAGSVEAVRALLDHGADPNATEDERGTTALMQAADQGHADVIAVLVAHGADVAARSAPVLRDGRTAALGKSEDPRESVRRQVIAVLCDQASPDLSKLRELIRESGEDAVLASVGGQANASGNPCNVKKDALGFVVTGAGRRRVKKEPDGGELTPLVYAARTGGIEAAQRAARCRRRREPGDALRLEPAARRDAEPQLSDGEVPHRARGRRQFGEQGRLDAALPRDGQPQPRGW